MNKCFYFGCMGQPGHHLYLSDTRAYVDYDTFRTFNIDGMFAPRVHRATEQIRFIAQNDKLKYSSNECPQGQYLRHYDQGVGYTLIQWWDRNQGDTRPACNSTIFLEGKHDSPDMIEALNEYFPMVAKNLKTADVELSDVTPEHWHSIPSLTPNQQRKKP